MKFHEELCLEKPCIVHVGVKHHVCKSEFFGMPELPSRKTSLAMSLEGTGRGVKCRSCLMPVLQSCPLTAQEKELSPLLASAPSKGQSTTESLPGGISQSEARAWDGQLSPMMHPPSTSQGGPHP